MPINSIEKKLIRQHIKKNNLDIVVSKGHKNFSGSQVNPNCMLLKIKSVESLQSFMRFVYDLNLQQNPEDRIIYRPAAGGNGSTSQSYSLTKSISDSDIVIQLVGDGFGIVERIGDTNIARIPAGKEIGEIERELYFNQGLMLANSSLIVKVTYEGLSELGGHGNAYNQPSCGELATAIEYILPNGEFRRIEKGSDPEFEILSAAAFGMAGVVICKEVECLPAQKVRLTKTPCSIDTMYEFFKDGGFYAAPNTSIMIAMHEQLVNPAVIYQWQFMGEPTEDDNYDPHTPHRDHFKDQIKMALSEKLQVTKFFNNPKFVRQFTKLLANVEIGDEQVIKEGDWPNVGHYLTAYPRSKELIIWDFLIPVSKDCHELTNLFQEFQKICEQFPGAISYAVYLRMIKASKKGLVPSLSDTDHVIGFDIVTTNNVKNFEQFKLVVENLFIRYGAKEHWGKNPSLLRDYPKIYGSAYDEFVQTLKDWYEKNDCQMARSPLINNFWGRDILKLADVPPVHEFKFDESAISEDAKNLTVPVSSHQNTMSPRTEMSKKAKYACSVIKDDEDIDETSEAAQSIMQTLQDWFVNPVGSPTSQIYRALSPRTPTNSPSQSPVRIQKGSLNQPGTITGEIILPPSQNSPTMYRGRPIHELRNEEEKKKSAKSRCSPCRIQ